MSAREQILMSFVSSMSASEFVDYYRDLLRKGGKSSHRIKPIIGALEEEIYIFALGHPRKAVKLVEAFIYRASLCNNSDWVYSMAYVAGQAMCWTAASGNVSRAMQCEQLIRRRIAISDEKHQRDLRAAVSTAFPLARMQMDNPLLRYTRRSDRPSPGITWLDYFTHLVDLSYYS